MVPARNKTYITVNGDQFHKKKNPHHYYHHHFQDYLIPSKKLIPLFLTDTKHGKALLISDFIVGTKEDNTLELLA